MNTLRNIAWLALAEKAVFALLILLATWIIARLVRAGLHRLTAKVAFLRHSDANGDALGDAIGSIGSLLVWLFGLVAIMEVLGIQQVLPPIQGMLAVFLGFLPRILGAGIVFFLGFVLAKIARQLVTAALAAAGLDRHFARLNGTTPTTARREATGSTAADASGAATSKTGLSAAIGNIVFAVIVLVVAISALQILGIAAISVPAAAMLALILTAIPRILAALVLLILGFFIAKFVAQLLESTLAGVGLDRAVNNLDLGGRTVSVSRIAARIAHIAIVLFFAVMATQMLGFPAITNMLRYILAIAGHVLFGAIIIAAGFAMATLLRRALGKDSTAGKVVYWVVIALFAAIGLQYMGLANSIVNLAFGAVVVGGAAAAALAFGLGGRNAAERMLNRAQRKATADDTTDDTTRTA